MRILLFALITPFLAFSQTNSACPGATGPLPHCVVFTWTAPTTGPAPTGYNIYSGGTATGNCASVTAATCTKIGSVTAPTLTFTFDTTSTAQLVEGSVYHYVITSVNGTAESAPSVEVASNPVPFLVPNAPTSDTATAK